VLLALIVCLIPTTIGGLLSAIGIAGIDRLMRRNVLATSGRAVEAAGDVDVLLLDKTGTITLGNRQATEFIPAPGVKVEELADAAQLASLADETPEGRSIAVLAKEKYGLRGREVAETFATFIPFSAQTRMSGVDLYDDGHGGTGTAQPAASREPALASLHPQAGAAFAAAKLPRQTPSAGAATKPIRCIRKGAAESVARFAKENGGQVDTSVMAKVDDISRQGGTPLLVADGARVLGVIQLKDIVKGGIKERFAQLRKMGISTVMITGDNPLTAAAIAAEAGVDDFIAQAKPEDKLARIRKEQEGGKLIAMIGDGTNDAPALAQADVGVAMNTGTQAAREAGNMVDLDSNPTKLIEVVEIGKQLLMTRGALTTFSIANDVSKYFAILPAMFGLLYATTAGGRGPLDKLNIMYLHSPQSAILSAVIFNALIIVALIPLALRGVKYRPLGAAVILRNNMLIYGVGGILVPFLFIKLIDLFLVAVHLAP
jgi:K+-transporting ATPase ATPase B chain